MIELPRHMEHFPHALPTDAPELPLDMNQPQPNPDAEPEIDAQLDRFRAQLDKLISTIEAHVPPTSPPLPV